MAKPQIALFTMGGTIAMTNGPDGGAVPSLDGASLIAAVPALGDLADISITELARLGSANIGLPQIIHLARLVKKAVADGIDGIVVTQGTDSLAYSAFALSMLINVPVPVIFTGAMRHPAMPSADGPANLLAAMRAACSPQLRGFDVLLCMNDELHSAVFAQKTHMSNLAAFQSPGAGPVACHSEGRIHVLARPVAFAKPDMGDDLSADQLPAVALHMIAYGSTGADLIWSKNISGLVIAGFGGGHVPESMVDNLADLAATMPVILASQSGTGRVLESTYGYRGAEIDLIARGLIPSGFFCPQKAFILLKILLAKKAKIEGIRAIFQQRPALAG
ncbi:L-asparaginase [Iodidimonas nitroreducens]|uniref:L-asparaginase n=1 Tax=Iodidimonas nitroreducens TaxID=1236968 RepID=A0A5A7N512_9PROT|nr:asparaginase [Iodidimonas nitroreducens]GAK32288.1 L-asparaginase [alpha proteobacterium Q-1]GER03382.1 L-asparaginase [Iodidimonas nitroreducens]